MLIYSRGAFVKRVAHKFFCSKWSFRNRYKCSYIKTIWYWTDSCVGRKLVATSAGEGWLTVMASKDETASKDDKGIGWREDKADMRLGNYTRSKRPVRAVQRRIPRKTCMFVMWACLRLDRARRILRRSFIWSFYWFPSNFLWIPGCST